ncbi:condensation domain-containing protein [Wukongibacter sp. M2B1]|uniref:condensation domain-containing protein n=1 Tax=Wukongibacter sp. M2B1 TaxID=3088895 RepID=UPI003D79B6D6
MDENRKIDARNVEDILPLTPMQKSMLFMLLMNPSGDFYFEQQRYRLSGHIIAELVEKAWAFVANNNEMLRTVFRWKGLENPVQIILREKKIPVKYIDLSHSTDCNELSDSIELQEWKNKVDITTDPFRIVLCKLSEIEYHMILSTHHIILDGWSNAIMLKEFYNAYHCIYFGSTLNRKPKVRYREYIQWLLKQRKDKAVEQWKKYLSGYSHYSTLPELSIRPPENYKIDIYSYPFKGDLMKAVESFTQKHGITLAALFYSVWGILQMQACRTWDLIFGITVSGRSPEVEGIEELIGVFIKTLPMRIKASPHEKIIDLVGQVSSDLVDIESTQIVELSDIMPYSDNDSRITMETAVVIQNYPLEKKLLSCFDGILKLELFSSRYATNFDVVLGIKLFPDYCEAEFSFNCNIYSLEQIQELCRKYISIIETVINIFDGESNKYDVTIQDIFKRYEENA